MTLTDKREPFLIPFEEFSLTLTESYNPREFWKTREGLYISPEFNKRILSVAVWVKKKKSVILKLKSWDLQKDAPDPQIYAELPQKYVFEEVNVFCHLLAGMISNQTSGEEGKLLTNGHSNLFPVKGKNSHLFTADIRWYSYSKKDWNLFAEEPIEYAWRRAGSRIFSLVSLSQ